MTERVGTSATAIEFLERRTFLGALPRPALQRLVAQGHMRRYGAGATICSRGDVGDHMLIVLSGSLKACSVDADGSEVVHNFLGAGDVAGEFSVLDGLPRSADLVAQEASVVLQLDREAIRAALIEHPEALMELTLVLCTKLRHATQTAEAFVKEALERVANGLVRLVEQHGVKQHGEIAIMIKLPQASFGNMVGVARSNVNRLLGDLTRAGIIRCHKGIIYIRNEAALRRVAEGAKLAQSSPSPPPPPPASPRSRRSRSQ